MRYIILVVVAIPTPWVFYLIFTPLTIYPVYFTLGLFFETSLIGNIILISGCFPIEIVGACIGGSAYYLLFILNLATPKINLKKRATMLFIAFLAFLILNILRIILLSFMFVSGSIYLEIVHSFFWFFLSTAFVVGIWFAEVKFFKIKEIPFYSDLKWIYNKTK